MKKITKLTVPIVGLRWNEHRLGMTTEEFLKRIKVGDVITFKHEPDGEYLRVIAAYKQHVFAGKVEEYASLLIHHLMNKYARLKGKVSADPFKYSYLVDVEFQEGDLDGLEDYMDKVQIPSLIIDRELCLSPPDWECSFQVMYEEIEDLMDEIYEQFNGQPESTKNTIKKIALERLVALMEEFRDKDHKTLCIEDPVHFIYMCYYIEEWSKKSEIVENYKEQIHALQRIVKEIRHERAHSYENGTEGKVYDVMERYVKSMFYQKGGTLEKFWAKRFTEKPEIEDLKTLKKDLTVWLNKIGKSAYTTILKKGDRLEWARILKHGKYTRKKLYQILSHLELARYVDRLLAENVTWINESPDVTEKKALLCSALKHMFRNNSEVQFVNEIYGLADRYITRTVNVYVSKKLLYEEYKNSKIYDVLFSMKIYTKSRSNWNSQVN